MKNWISVSKEVPSESKIYNITYKSTSGRRRSDSAFYNSQKKIWYWDEAVSYTHLDVYKRQVKYFKFLALILVIISTFYPPGNIRARSRCV